MVRAADMCESGGRDGRFSRAVPLALAIVCLLLAFSGAFADAAARDRLRVLVDLSHHFTFEVHNGLHGYLEGQEVTSSLAALTAEMLPPYDVVVASDSGTPAWYSPQEIALLADFVQQGGGLFIYAGAGTAESAVASLCGAFALELTDMLAREPYYGLTPALLEEGGFVAVSGGKARVIRGPGTPILWDADRRPIGIARRFGRGRVIFVNMGRLLDNPADKRIVKKPYRNVEFVNACFDWLGGRRIGDRGRELLPTRVALVPPESLVSLPGFEVRYSQNMPLEKRRFLVEALPRIYELVCREFGYQPEVKREVWALMTGGGGFTGGRVVAVGATGTEVATASFMIHELANSLCVETPVWLGDGAWSGLVQIRVKNKLGGEFARSVEGKEEQLIAHLRDYEEKHGVYDISSGEDLSAGRGKLLLIIRELESRYGEGIMPRYFAAARHWKDRPELRDVPPVDRIVFYFSMAAGDELAPYFGRLGTQARPVYSALDRPRRRRR